MSHGLFVSSGSHARTYFHHVEPSKHISFHLINPNAGKDSVIEINIGSSIVKSRGRSVSVFSKFKAFMKDKLMRPCRDSSSMSNGKVNAMLGMVAAFLSIDITKLSWGVHHQRGKM